MRKQKSKRRIIKGLVKDYARLKAELAAPLVGHFGPCQGLEPLFYKGVPITTEQDPNTLYRVLIQE